MIVLKGFKVLAHHTQHAVALPGLCMWKACHAGPIQLHVTSTGIIGAFTPLMKKVNVMLLCS